MESKTAGLLGICRRAGHLTVGFDAVRDLVIQGRAALVMFAFDVSPKTAKELRFALQEHPAPLCTLTMDKVALSAALGLQKPIGIVATDDNGFATALRKYIPAEMKEEDTI